MAFEIEERVAQFVNFRRVARLAMADALGRLAVVPICHVFDGTTGMSQFIRSWTWIDRGFDGALLALALNSLIEAVEERGS